jgi:hypothetical protein
MTAANEWAAGERPEAGREVGWAAAEPTWEAPAGASGERSRQSGKELKSSAAYLPQLPPASHSAQVTPAANWTQPQQSTAGWPYQGPAASPYQAPGYPVPGGYRYDPSGYAPPGYGYPAAGRTNGFAIAAFVCAFFFSLLGVIFGFVALSQIKRTGEGGRGLAIAGIVISIAAMAFFLILWISLIAAAGSIDSNYGSLGPAGGAPPVVSQLAAPA